MTRKLAVVLFNLGGPDGPKAVRPFLFNLFRDPAIIGAPGPIRYALAALIAGLRAKTARANYARMGGGSPLLPETQKQAAALEAVLREREPDVDARVFVAMRYWRPLTDETARTVKAFGADETVLLPLYPQFSSTTTASSLKAWERAGPGGAVRTVCCYPDLDLLADAHATTIRSAWEAAGRPEPVRLLFSAHGVPLKCIAAGDPYQAQVEATVAAVAARLPEFSDWRICYQSRVGPLQWLGPSTPEAIEEAAGEGLGVLISPIAFVSEHIETLVELDHEYGELAATLGCPAYVRAPALCVQRAFIEGLADLVQQAQARPAGVEPGGPWRCGAQFGQCPNRRQQQAAA
jgi:protoporphyrin/coproporphyrin ferrochelatase